MIGRLSTRVAVAAIVLSSCSPDAAIPDSTTHAEPPREANRSGELVESAKDLVAFLRGETDFDRLTIADTVVLYLAPEGGGDRARVPRDRLRDRGNWQVRAAESGTSYPFVPPSQMHTLTTRVGRHFNCLDHDLSSRYPQLAALPHVGTRLEPIDPAGCLQTWNLTFVFDPHAPNPTLAAVVYDQWEW